MILPIKPEVCVIGDRLAVFLGADYKFMPLDVAEGFVQTLQHELAALRYRITQGQADDTSSAT